MYVAPDRFQWRVLVYILRLLKRRKISLVVKGLLASQELCSMAINYKIQFIVVKCNDIVVSKAQSGNRI
jgi:hypothetical protein